jgi:hypothetical protein
LCIELLLAGYARLFLVGCLTGFGLNYIQGFNCGAVSHGIFDFFFLFCGYGLVFFILIYFYSCNYMWLLNFNCVSESGKRMPDPAFIKYGKKGYGLPTFMEQQYRLFSTGRQH